MNWHRIPPASFLPASCLVSSFTYTITWLLHAFNACYHEFSQVRSFPIPLWRHFRESARIHCCFLMVQLNVLVTQARGIQWNLTVLVMTWIAPLEVKLRAHSAQIEDIPLASLRLKVNLTELQGYFCHGNTGGGNHSFLPCLCSRTLMMMMILKKTIRSKLQREHFQQLSSGKFFRFF